MIGILLYRSGGSLSPFALYAPGTIPKGPGLGNFVLSFTFLSIFLQIFYSYVRLSALERRSKHSYILIPHAWTSALVPCSLLPHPLLLLPKSPALRQSKKKPKKGRAELERTRNRGGFWTNFFPSLVDGICGWEPRILFFLIVLLMNNDIGTWIFDRGWVSNTRRRIVINVIFHP